MAAVAVNVAVGNNNNDYDPSFAPCPSSLTATLLSTIFHMASSGVTQASSHCHYFAVILAALATQASLLRCRCAAIAGGTSNARVVALP
jgi:hypothetical protein